VQITIFQGVARQMRWEPSLSTSVMISPYCRIE